MGDGELRPAPAGMSQMRPQPPSVREGLRPLALRRPTRAICLPAVEPLGVELLYGELELVRPVKSACESYGKRPVVVVRVAMDEGIEGFGECVALPSPTYDPEYALGSLLVLEKHLQGRFLAAGRLRPEHAMGALSAVKGHNAAKTALEAAVADASCKLAGLSLARALGAIHERVPAGAVLGIPASALPRDGQPGSDEAREALSSLIGSATGLLASGYKRLKCKIMPGWDYVPLSALREAFPDIVLLGDANESYDRMDFREVHARLQALAPLRLAGVEQPLARDRIMDHARLSASVDVPIGLDESLRSLNCLDMAIELRACEVACIKAARIGGIFAACAALERCREAGITAYVGGMFETAIGRFLNAALAAMPGATLAGDMGDGGDYYEAGIGGHFPVDAGTIAVPEEPGIIGSLPEALMGRLISRGWYPRGGAQEAPQA